MTEGQAFCHEDWEREGRRLNRQGEKDAKGREAERVHSERCRDADILSGVACGEGPRQAVSVAGLVLNETKIFNYGLHGFHG